MIIISAHAAVGMRFHHAAYVYPCEFNTSFMPEIARASTALGCVAAAGRTADHNSFCSSDVSALIFASRLRSRVVARQLLPNIQIAPRHLAMEAGITHNIWSLRELLA